jgi:hypothetical protein
MRCSRQLAALVAAAGLLTGAPAGAGACCVGSTSSAPSAVGECETWTLGLGATGEARLARWDGEGQVTADSLEEQALVSTLGAGYRWSRSAFATLDLPWRLSHRAAGELDAVGQGFGDARVTLVWDPLEETPPGSGRLPPPVLRLGARLPTGRAWDASEDALAADVTGLPGAAVTGGVALQRSMGQVPWSLGVSAEVPVGVEGAPSLLSAAGSLGRYLGSYWTVTGSLRYERTLALYGGGAWSTARTTAGLRVIHGRRMAWRAWAGGGLDLPVASLGLENPVMASASAGFMVVR